MNLLSLKIGNTIINTPANLPQPDTAGKILSNALSIFITVGIIASILSIIWAGIQWITSGGDKQKLASAKARITWSIVGLIIMFVSFLIINMFGHFFGVKLLNITL